MHSSDTPGGEEKENPPEASAVGALISRPVHVPELFLCTHGLGVEVHDFFDASASGLVSKHFSWATLNRLETY